MAVDHCWILAESRTGEIFRDHFFDFTLSENSILSNRLITPVIKLLEASIWFYREQLQYQKQLWPRVKSSHAPASFPQDHQYSTPTFTFTWLPFTVDTNVNERVGGNLSTHTQFFFFYFLDVMQITVSNILLENKRNGKHAQKTRKQVILFIRHHQKPW